MGQKRVNGETSNDNVQAKRRKQFDFKSHPKRKIAFQFLYLGWEHDGLVQQLNTQNTVEHHIMAALLKTHLIEDWTTCDFSRCGRTDKGVSAFKQTAALIVRSSNPEENGVFWDDDASDETKNNYKSKGEELNYVKMLNGVLPKSIRVFRWAPVSKEFNARFDCNRRGYKYAFPKANLDVEKMRQACKLLIGEHDFSNFCQIDMNEKRLEQSYVRKIYDVKIEEVSKNRRNSDYDIIELTVEGSGFLWHMIRYIVTILNEIGRGNEELEIISDLLDLSKYPSRPQYTLASDTPLCLFDCEYDNSQLEWKTDDNSTSSTIAGLQKTWSTFQARSQMIDNMMNELSNISPNACQTKGLHEFVQDRPIPSNYVKFANRPKCESLQSKKDKLAAKKMDP